MIFQYGQMPSNFDMSMSVSTLAGDRDSNRDSNRDSRDKEKQIVVLEGDELKERVKIFVPQRLGGGASGRVYRASLDKKPCAAKIIHPSAARREDAVASFLKEANLLSRLQHGYAVLYCLHSCSNRPKMAL